MRCLLRSLSFALLLCLLLTLYPAAVHAAEPEDFDLEEQLDALGRGELMEQVPEEAREMMEDSEIYELSPDTLLQLTPQNFFRTLWRMLLDQFKKPSRTLGAMLAVVVLCALLESLKSAAWEESLSGVFQTISVLCILGFIASPILECIVRTTDTIRDATLFMASFIPTFTASMISAGQPVTGATYNLFLFATCQVVGQVAATFLIPLMSVYLALCVTGAFLPDLKLSSAAGAIKSAVSWTLSFMLTIFVTLLSIQSMLSHGADGVTVKAAKFLIGSVVPVVGSVLADAYVAAQGCLHLVRTTVGVYGVLVAIFTFLPTLLRILVWYIVAKVASSAGEVAGVGGVTGVLKSCANVLGVLIAVIVSFMLLIVVSTAAVLAISG